MNRNKESLKGGPMEGSGSGQVKHLSIFILILLVMKSFLPAFKIVDRWPVVLGHLTDNESIATGKKSLST